MIPKTNGNGPTLCISRGHVRAHVTHMQMEKEIGTRKANGKGLAVAHRKKTD